MITIYIDVNPETKRVEGWGSSPISPNSVMIEIDENHEFMRNSFMFKYINGELVKDDSILLEMAKQRKDEELNRACQQSILNGFTHIIDGIKYHFSFDTEAQLNFQGAERLFTLGVIDEVRWTVHREDGSYDRIIIDKKLMDELSAVILKHKNNNISKYRDVLLPMVEKAETIEEVESITWDSV